MCQIDNFVSMSFKLTNDTHFTLTWTKLLNTIVTERTLNRTIASPNFVFPPQICPFVVLTVIQLPQPKILVHEIPLTSALRKKRISNTKFENKYAIRIKRSNNIHSFYNWTSQFERIN